MYLSFPFSDWGNLHKALLGDPTRIAIFQPYFCPVAEVFQDVQLGSLMYAPKFRALLIRRLLDSTLASKEDDLPPIISLEICIKSDTEE